MDVQTNNYRRSKDNDYMCIAVCGIVVWVLKVVLGVVVEVVLGVVVKVVLAVEVVSVLAVLADSFGG